MEWNGVRQENERSGSDSDGDQPDSPRGTLHGPAAMAERIRKQRGLPVCTHRAGRDTEKETDRQTDRQSNKQTHKHIHRRTERKDRVTERQRHRVCEREREIAWCATVKKQQTT